MSDRREAYFTFQGLLMAVLLLLFLYECPLGAGWSSRLFFLVSILGLSLISLRLISKEIIFTWWFQNTLFVGDAVIASITLQWTQPQSELYLIYFLIIFGTALTRSFRQSVAVAIVTSALYLASSWKPGVGFPNDTTFWLRVHFLWITAALLAILSRDSQRIQKERDDKYRERLIQIGRLATLGQVAGEVAHRIKGPLTTILVNAEVLSHRAGKSKEMLRELDQIQEEVGRCKDILKNLLDLGRIEEIDFTTLDLRDPVRSAIDSMQPQIHKKRIQLEAQGLSAPMRVRGDQSLLHEAVAAVLQNAVDAGRPGGRINVKAESRSNFWTAQLRGNGRYALTIEDDGAGIRREDLEKIFQPFFTTKGGDGSGIGLSAALRILQKHDGSIEAFSEGPGQGARFVLTLPRASPSRRFGKAGRSA